MAQILNPDVLSAFIEWLDVELDQRGWSDYKLAKVAHISHPVISKARAGLQPIGWDACVRIADALELPPHLVLEKAGLLPPSPLSQSDPELDELAFLFQQLLEEDRARILSIARTFLPKKGGMNG